MNQVLPLLLSVLFSVNAFAGTVVINGKTFTCNGNVSVNNNDVICDGKRSRREKARAHVAIPKSANMKMAGDRSM